MKHYSILLFLLLLIPFGSCQRHPSTLTVASYNLRYANHADSMRGDGWGQRYPIIVQLIQAHDFEIFGTQECLSSQLADLEQALPQYAHIGVGREDGIKKGEHSAIFYRKDLFEVIEHGDFWLSETPDKPSIGWDAVLPRICTWGHFRIKSTGFEFLFFNLHMDHVGKQARIESASLVQQKMKELGKGLPAILTGDFNVDQTHSSYEALTKNHFLYDCFTTASTRYAMNGTFNSFDAECYSESRIDHIFVTQQFEVKKYAILTDSYRTPIHDNEKKDGRDYPSEVKLQKFKARTPSDHFPVRVQLIVK